MTGTVFTLGYQLRSLADFINELNRAGVDAVIDVRETPWSHKPGFSLKQLSAALDEAQIRYLHARFAGNPRAIRAQARSHAACLCAYAEYLTKHPVVLQQLESLVVPFLDSGKNVCLVCYERHPDDCHRSILLSQWPLRYRVAHLGTEGAPRFITNQKVSAVA